MKLLDQRIGTYCNQKKIENEVHFLIECDIYDDLRVELLSKYAEFNTDFTDFNANDRLFLVMHCTPYLYALAKLVFTMYNRRKSFP